jgi:predicted MFS family arabinose efflux permease
VWIAVDVHRIQPPEKPHHSLRWVVLPTIPPKAAMKTNDLGAMLLRSNVRRSLLLVALQFVAHFTAYTYIAPFLERNALFPASWIAPVLLGFGIVGFVANFAASAVVTLHLRCHCLHWAVSSCWRC